MDAPVVNLKPLPIDSKSKSPISIRLSCTHAQKGDCPPFNPNVEIDTAKMPPRQRNIRGELQVPPAICHAKRQPLDAMLARKMLRKKAKFQIGARFDKEGKVIRGLRSEKLVLITWVFAFEFEAGPRRRGKHRSAGLMRNS